MKALFLCTEMSGYFISCIQQFKKQEQAKIKLICYPGIDDAPFVFDTGGIDIMIKNSFSRSDLLYLALEFKPDLVYVGGWADKDYFYVTRQLKSKGVKVVCGVDNPWNGSIRQRVASLLSGWLIRPYVTNLWVAGRKQFEFAKRLGFKSSEILSGLYAANINSFRRRDETIMENYLIYVGRFEKIKGVDLLYKVFTELNEKERNGWKLKMVGNGKLKESLLPTSNVEIFDFMQPDYLAAFSSGAGGFILPSRYEPWGVVVQEFAAAGKPLLLSTEVNSGEQFLVEGKNGFTFISNDYNDLKSVLIKFFHLPAQDRKKMGAFSRDLSNLNSPQKWVEQLISVVPKKIHSN